MAFIRKFPLDGPLGEYISEFAFANGVRLLDVLEDATSHHLIIDFIKSSVYTPGARIYRCAIPSSTLVDSASLKEALGRSFSGVAIPQNCEEVSLKSAIDSVVDEIRRG